MNTLVLPILSFRHHLRLQLFQQFVVKTQGNMFTSMSAVRRLPHRRWPSPSDQALRPQENGRSSPPNGCLQYFYSQSGRIQTFNFPDTAHLQSQRYNVYIRPENGMCCIRYQVCANEPNAFSLSSGGIKDGTAKPAILDNLCTLDYIEIIGSSLCSGSTDLHSRYCGGIFSTDTTATTDYITICDCTQPFRISFVTDALPDSGAAITENVGTSRGNCFDYTQIPCGTTGPNNS